jgi:hypothetical protein
MNSSCCDSFLFNLILIQFYSSAFLSNAYISAVSLNNVNVGKYGNLDDFLCLKMSDNNVVIYTGEAEIL